MYLVIKRLTGFRDLNERVRGYREIEEEKVLQRIDKYDVQIEVIEERI